MKQPPKTKRTLMKVFGKTALAEGISYLLLLFIAMPLKYLFDFPLMVKYVGWLHGLLFIVYGILLLSCWIAYRWSIARVLFFFFASLVPILPFFVERRLQREYEEEL